MPDAPHKLTGVVDDRYAIERELGRGGMAIVYLARDLRHGSRVALKVLTADFASVVSGERFAREIHITAGLQHPHILPVFDSGEVDGLPYYVMPYVEGPTLEQKIRAEGALQIGEALEIASEVADALAHAHAEGFVHRDIKPSNILLAHGHAVVADFGIARTVEISGDQQLTRTGIAVGTAAYMSPEQASGTQVDGRSDIYSLGCVLFEMLAGHPPYRASSPRALMAKHWLDDIPSLRAIRATVRVSLETLVAKALAKDPDERFATAGEFEDAIQKVSTEEKVAEIGMLPHSSPLSAITSAQSVAVDGTRPSTAAGSTARSVRSSRTAIAIGSLALAAVFAVVWLVARPKEPELDRNRVMIYPLIVPADFKGSRTLGEDVSTVIGSALDGAGPLKWVDGWQLLDPAARQDMGKVTDARLVSLAKSRRCAYFLRGRLASRGDSSAVFLDLWDVAGDSSVAKGTAIGAASEEWKLGLRAVNSILPTLIPSGSHDMLAEWNDRNPAAIASFLLGEAAFRRVHLPEALDAYRNAVRADSTFSLAAIRGAQAATWNHRSSEAESFITTALRQPMSPRYTAFARGYKYYLTGSADSAAAQFQNAVAIDPEMSVAWMQLGEVYTHLLPETGNPDSLAGLAFDEAHRLDPAATNILFHPIEIRLRHGRVEGTQRLVADFLAADPDTLLAQQVRVMFDCAQKGSAKVQWAQMTQDHPLAVLAAANSFKGGGAPLTCARSGFEAVLTGDSDSGRRWMGMIGLGSVLLAENRTSEARARIDAFIARTRGGSTFYLMAAPFHPALKEQARIAAHEFEVRYGADYASCPYPVLLWQLGVWEALDGRLATARAIQRNLDSTARKTALPATARLARSVAAFTTLAEGDSAKALTRFKALIDEPVPGADLAWDLAAPRGSERLVLARLLAAKKDYRKAIDVANVFDASWPVIYLLYLPPSLELRAVAAEWAGDNDMAARFRSRLDALHKGQ
ncbi:MAG TPA: serine/threonine-protein kinase [Gemmatimonadaceae bacterium]|nr:serine/threonine-protein kinase [Gemmatimonadaceae bacterium]